MTFQDPGARVPVDIQVRLRSGSAPFNPDSLPDYEPPKKAAPEKQAAPTAAPSVPFDPDSLPDYKPSEQTKSAEIAGPQMGAPEKAWRGVLDSASFGTVGAVDALGAAAGPEWHQTQAAHDFAPVVGAAKMLHSYLAGHPDDEVRKDYNAGLEKAAAERKEAGQVLVVYGGPSRWRVATPAFGAMKAGGLGARAAAGAIGGGIGGGLYGAGSGLSEGEEAPDIAKQALTSGVAGALTGGALSGALGPRLINPLSPGQRAAATARDLGGTIPKGLASDRPSIQTTTAAMQSAPVVGSWIGHQVGDVARAGG